MASFHRCSHGISSYSPETALMNPCKDLIVFNSKFALENSASTIEIPANWPFELNFDMAKNASPSSFNDDAKMNELIDEMYLLKLDPLKWKEQDHYKVLGLSLLRQDATLSDIKRAYQKMVLLYHPDKRQQQQGDNASTYEANSNLFKCIQRAYEVLMDPQQRHGFDSVDPAFDETIPDAISKKKLDSDPLIFYKTFIPVFEANARFSKIKPVPHLGNPSTSRAEVEVFYHFWYNFDSSRTFEYLDEEDTNHADNRYDKRYLDKKNRAARLKRKTEDNARIRMLVDNAVRSDPRLKMFKEQDKQAKEDQRKLKQFTAAKKASSSNTSQSERVKSKQAEEAEKTRLLEVKKQKEAERACLKQLRKEIRSKIKAHQFFTPSNVDLLERRILLIESKLDKFTSIKELEAFSSHVSKEIESCLETGDVDGFYSRNFEIDSAKNATEPPKVSPIKQPEVKAAETASSPEWTAAEIQCLIKACNTIPGGTKNRWEKIADYVREHANLSHTRTNNEIIEKSQEIQKLGKSALENLDENELQNSLKKKADPRIEDGKPCSNSLQTPTPPKPVAWTKAEQMLLEEGLRKYPSSHQNRWDLIAEMIPTKTKQQVISRFGEIAKLLQARK